MKPVGSRRRRAAIASTRDIPFHQLPYQCFQEARKVLIADRREKVDDIAKQRDKIARLQERIDGGSFVGGQRQKEEQRIEDMKKRVEDLKILADINDPVVKRKWEDGFGDMNKPIYRHLSDLKWRSYKRKVLMQRITQMDLIPDVLPSIDPTLNVSLAFGRKNIQHGDIVPSLISERLPTMDIQPYEAGNKLVTIAVVNPDVPNVAKDGYDYRCHFLAVNIPISPTQTKVDFAALSEEEQIVIPWLPPYAQKGLSYQRLGIFVLEQQGQYEQSADLGYDKPQQWTTNAIPIASLRAEKRYSTREKFILRSLSTVYRLKPIGVDLFRTKWDEDTAGVMERAGVVGGDVEFKRKRIEPLPYQRLKSERFR